jgi:Leucine-rich repeat (LRR) protein
MQLTFLDCAYNRQLSDLSPLKDVPLRKLLCFTTQVSDLSPLQNCKSLKELQVSGTRVTPTSVAALQKALPNCKIEWDDPAKPKTPEPAASGTK